MQYIYQEDFTTVWKILRLKHQNLYLSDESNMCLQKHKIFYLFRYRGRKSRHSTAQNKTKAIITEILNLYKK